MDSPSSAVPIWGSGGPVQGVYQEEVLTGERLGGGGGRGALISAFSGGTFWSWQATSPPQDRMRSRTRTISQTGGRRLGPWNRLRMRASACRAEPEQGGERGARRFGPWRYLLFSKRGSESGNRPTGWGGYPAVIRVMKLELILRIEG